jgi:hypothetical protein
VSPSNSRTVLVARDARAIWFPLVDAVRTFCFTPSTERRTLLLETQWYTDLAAQAPNRVGAGL